MPSVFGTVAPQREHAWLVPCAGTAMTGRPALAACFTQTGGGWRSGVISSINYIHQCDGEVFFNIDGVIFRQTDMTKSDIAHRAEATVAAVLPPTVLTRRGREDGRVVDLELNGQSIQVAWLGEGGLRQAREVIASRRKRPDVVAARRMSPGAREALSAVGIGWVDETGAAEIVLESLIVSRSGRPPKAPQKPPRWTPSVLAVAEALLCGGRATVGAMQEITGLSTGSATYALRALTDLGLMDAAARRGRNSARQIPDQNRLLDAYAAAAAAMLPQAALTVGVTWRDPATALTHTGQRWDSAGISWAATGAVAAAVFAPYLTTVTTGEVYVDRKTIAGLESVAAAADLHPIEGGRLTLRPFPTVTARRLAETKQGLSLAPWPRVYADLRVVGVRGEEAAEHLRDVIRGR